jgi:integrase
MLSAKKVEKLKKPGRYGDQHGLYLQVRGPTNKSWLFRYERDGRERMMGIGPVHTFSLKEARDKARAARQQLKDGIDPLDARRAGKTERALAAAKAMTFEQCAQAYFDANADRWRNAKHRAQFMSTLRNYAYPTIGGLAVADIDVGLVLKVLEPIWKSKPETAARVRGRIETVLSWATVRGYRNADNPARWRGFLSTQLTSRGKQFAPVKHHPALPFTELPAFMSDLRERHGVAARALEFTILTAARTGAVIGATWAEIDFKEKVWTVPPDRAGTKIDGNKPRRVPVADQVVELLERVPRERGNPHLFIGDRAGTSLSNMAMLVLLERMGRDDITVHGFRSTFKDWVSERTNYPNHVSEAALWHAVADKVEAAYRRGDLFNKRRLLMRDWAKYCYGPALTAAIVPLRGCDASKH